MVAMVNEMRPNFKDVKKLYEEAKSKSNYGHWIEAAELFLKAAENFEKLGEKAWAARVYGRVAWNKMEAEEFEEAERFLEISKQLDFNQATLNYVWCFYICFKKKNEKAARKYLLESVSMIYQEIKFDHKELKKQRRLLYTNLPGFLIHIFEVFYNKKVEIEDKINEVWSRSDKSRLKTLLALLTKFDPSFYKPEEIYENAKNAGLNRLSRELEEKKELYSKNIEIIIRNIQNEDIKIPLDIKKLKISIFIFVCFMALVIIFLLLRYGIDLNTAITIFMAIITTAAIIIKMWE